jgi:hypothetical protein
MSGWGTQGANLALAAALNGGTNRWLGLGTGIGAGGVLLGEISGGNYSRAALGSVTVTANAATNAATITFPTPNASLGTFTHAAVFDAASGGNVIASGALLAPVDWISGTPVAIQAGDADFTGVLAA